MATSFTLGVHGGGSAFVLALDRQYVGCRLIFTGYEHMYDVIRGLKKNLANVAPLFMDWRSIWEQVLEFRFLKKGQWKGGSKWDELSLASTVPIREYRDMVRVSPPKLGGAPAVLFETHSGDPPYRDSWKNASVTQFTTDANQYQGATMELSNFHYAIINEFDRRAGGCFGNAWVPARPWAWIVGDGGLQRWLVEAFHNHLWEGVDSAVQSQSVAW